MTEFDIESVVREIRSMAGSRKRIVFVSGNFNILHPGHIRFLRFAKACGDFLAVGVQSDQLAGSSVYVGEEHRLDALRSISDVDFSFLLRVSPSEFIRSLRPAVVVKGKEHESRKNPEQDAVDEYGGKWLFSSGEVVFSSLELLQNEFASTQTGNIRDTRDYLQRHSITTDQLRTVIQSFSRQNVIIIGDSIIDEYITCDPVGMSREEPTLVLTPLLKKKFAGGAAIVAGHAAALGASVSFFTVSGNDAEADFLEEHLKTFKLKHFEVLRDSSRPTTLKQRFRADNHSLLRLNTFRQHEISKELQENIFQKTIGLLDKATLLVFSDFNYGCLPQELVNRILDECQKRKVMVVADSQTSSQVGDISRYTNAKLLTPTEHEMRTALQDFRSGMVVAAEKLRQKTHAENILVTLGENGVFIHAGNKDLWANDQIPALNSHPQDISGAGDSLLIATSLALASHANIWQSAYIGSLAAACQVSRLGNIPLALENILDLLQH